MTTGGCISLETGFSDLTHHDLRNRGHDIRNITGEYGGYQAILWDDKRQVYFGTSESRKDGQAAGY